jgi:hypothetical protein
MTPTQKLDSILDSVQSLAMLSGRVDRELAELTVTVKDDIRDLSRDVRELAAAVEILQVTVEGIRAEVARHGQKLAPCTGVACAHSEAK